MALCHKLLNKIWLLPGVMQMFKYNKSHDSSSAMQRLTRPLKLVFFICKCAGILWTSVPMGGSHTHLKWHVILWIQLKCDETFTLLPLASWFNLSHLDDVMFFCNNNYIINLLFPGTTSSLWLLAACKYGEEILCLQPVIQWKETLGRSCALAAPKSLIVYSIQLQRQGLPVGKYPEQ